LVYALRKEHRQRVFKNSVLRKLFGLTMDEITGDGRKELYAVYFSPNIIW